MATYFLIVPWLPPAGRRPTLRSASLYERELATAARNASSEKRTCRDTNICSLLGRTDPLAPTVGRQPERPELGSQGSNPVLISQSDPCFQLHHSPLAEWRSVSRGRYYDARVPEPTVVILAAGEGT